MYSYLFVCAAGKVRPTVPPAETVRTTAINGNGQQHFQGDIRDDPLPLSLPFPFTPQEKAGKTRLTNRILTFFLVYAVGKARPTVPSAETVWTTAINGNGRSDPTRAVSARRTVPPAETVWTTAINGNRQRPTAFFQGDMTYVMIHCLSYYIFCLCCRTLSHRCYRPPRHSDHSCGQRRRSVCSGAHLSSQVH